MKIYPRVLGIRQHRVLARSGPLLTSRGFYLGGGTAIALQLGHRKSLDLDWFTRERIKDPLLLAQLLRAKGLPFAVEETASATLHGRACGVRVSFLSYPYRALRPPKLLQSTDTLLASLDDLATMKLSALAQRGAKKDFVDLYALGRKHAPLRRLLQLYRRRFKIADVAHLLYALTYFKDADAERMPVMLWRVRWSEIKTTISAWVTDLAK